MAARRYRLTPELIKKLSTSLEAGAFEHVAAELAGIPYQVYQEWLKCGQQARAGTLYRELYQTTQRAKAHARFMTESYLRTKEPRYWLLHGPGKETNDRPGWSAAPRAGADTRPPAP